MYIIFISKTYKLVKVLLVTNTNHQLKASATFGGKRERHTERERQRERERETERETETDRQTDRQTDAVLSWIRTCSRRNREWQVNDLQQMNESVINSTIFVLNNNGFKLRRTQHENHGQSAG